MKEVLVNTIDYVTSVGVYHRESHMFLENGCGAIKHRKFFNGKEYDTVNELEADIGSEKFKILGDEVKELSFLFDAQINASMCHYD